MKIANITCNLLVCNKLTGLGNFNAVFVAGVFAAGVFAARDFKSDEFSA